MFKLRVSFCVANRASKSRGYIYTHLVKISTDDRVQNSLTMRSVHHNKCPHLQEVKRYLSRVWGFRPCPRQINLYSHRRWLEA